MDGVSMDLAVEAHGLDARVVASGLRVDPTIGLRSSERDRRASAAGPNELQPAVRQSIPAMIVETITEPFLLVLVGAGILAIALGETRDGILILLALLPIVGADVITEYRADRALDALREASAPTARVRRDGEVGETSAAGLVPGDVVLLRVGDVVPADLRLIRADALAMDRSVLTGESVPVSGAVDPDAPEAPLIARHAIGYAGTSIVGGRGEGLVVAIGHGTEFGRIAERLHLRERRRSPLGLELDRLVRILLVLAAALVVIVTGLGFLRGQPAGTNLLAGISAAIAAVPEEPPILLAVVLGLGAYRLLRRDVLVRRLDAQETLGSIDLIITDKTGTLTHNRLAVASVVTLDEPATDETRDRLLGEALRAEDDAWSRAEGDPPGSFTTAIARALDARGAPSRLDPSNLLDVVPIGDARPVCRTRSRGPDGVVELAIGAPESILALTREEAPLPWLERIESLTRSGERVVGLARRPEGGTWAMRALIGFDDPVRPGIREALATARGAGIRVVVVTGDHPSTASAIAASAGLDASHMAVGEAIAGWADERVATELATLSVVARSTPDLKERLVRIARDSGRTVAVTGDGVNDAPALNAADVAVAMGSGTTVAKEAADLVLGDDSFATLMYGLAEGRRIVDNVQKGLIFLISTHVALLGFILIATIYGFGQPLFPIQILWLELFIDLSTSVAFELEKAEPDTMVRRPRPRGVPLLTNDLFARIGAAGGFSAVAAFVVMVAHPGTPDQARWLAFTVLVCGQAVRAYANRSLRTPIHRLPPNPFLLVVGLLVIAVQILIPWIPPLADAFRAVVLSPAEWAVVVVIALGPALLAELVRTTTRRAWVA